MRLGICFGLVLALAGICVAQDTNFSVGPQYLVTSGSPMFARPIATPNLSLGEPLPQIAGFPAAQALVTPESSSPSEPSQLYLSGVLWGEHSDARILGRVIVTPSLSLSEPPAIASAATDEQTTAPETTSEIEISSAAPRLPVPPSLFDAGVTGVTNAQYLRERGYGVPLGDTASFWKKNKPRAPRVYTNSDVERLHRN